MADHEARISVLEHWKDDHTDEHKALWSKVDATHDRSITTETKLAIYTAMGVGAGSVLGGVISALLVKLLGG